MNSVLIVAALALGLSQATHAAEIVGRVVSVADGDAISVIDASKEQHKIKKPRQSGVCSNAFAD